VKHLQGPNLASESWRDNNDTHDAQPNDTAPHAVGSEEATNGTAASNRTDSTNASYGDEIEGDIEVEDLLEQELAPSAPSRPWQGFFWGSIFLLTATVSAAFGAWFAMVTPLPPRLVAQTQDRFALRDLWKQGVRYQITRPVNILVMGIDRVPEAPRNSPEVLSGRTDTMLLVHIDPTRETLTVLSIPRDTQVEMTGYGVMKINQANVIGGPSLSARIVSQTLNDVPVDRYVRVSTEAFREVVDLIGGVEVFVPEPMQYTDETQKLYIDLAEGWQTLNGEQAEQFARFRHDEFGDIGRVQRQQQLLQALRDRLTSPSVIPRIPKLIRVVQRYLDTNLSVEEMLALANFGLDLDQSSFRMIMLPGQFSNPDDYTASYWIKDAEASEQLISQYFLDTVTTNSFQKPVSQLRIAIQNASDQPDAAGQMADLLYEQGFRDTYILSDWPDQIRETQVIAQRGDLEGAETLTILLGEGRVVAASTGSIESDLTIRIGEDWVEQQRNGGADLPSLSDPSASPDGFEPDSFESDSFESEPFESDRFESDAFNSADPDDPWNTP
jgi:LCP family protein required for cell wall assembly